ncbi:MAG: hypothetical protein ACRDRB_21445 [Pseudonocardiaceae bacterium]
MSKKTIYRHFPDRRSLLAAVRIGSSRRWSARWWRRPRTQRSSRSVWPGTRIRRCRRVAIMALPSRTPQLDRWPVVRCSVAVSWCSQLAMLAASSAPHL